MLFNSYYFLIYFLPIVLVCYYAAHKHGLHKFALIILSIASFTFYAYDNVYYLSLLAGSILINWCISYILNRMEDKNGRKAILTLGIIIDIAVIFYFKYYDFFIENMNALFKADFNLRHIILPLGISFFTFQQISYLVDTYRGETKGYDFIEYVAFVSFFPQLVAGPIVLHSELIPQYRDESRWKISSDRLAEGLYILAIGMFKKVIIADKFGQVVTWGWLDIHSRTGLDLLLLSLFYTFQLYFDFSGYCDMAIGIAKLFSLDLPINFNSPYKAVSINDFWKRWHMTLTRFFTRYLYIPLGGSRKGKLRTYLNILIVFLVSGLWHGAAWTFMIWGAMHGLAMIWDRRSFLKIKYKWLSGFFTRAFVVVAFIVFRSDNIDFMLRMLKAMFVYNGVAFVPELASCLSDLPEFYILTRAMETLAPGMINAVYVLLLTVLLITTAVILHRKNAHAICTEIRSKNYPTGYAVYLAALLGMVVVSLNQVSTFLYFNF